MHAPYLFAGDRSVAVSALRALIDLGDPPLVLCVSDRPSATHAGELGQVFNDAGGRHVLHGSELRSPDTLAWLDSLDLDLALSVHYPELVRTAALAVPRRGWLNLHPAYLPFNRGWHTPSWAILEGTPAGATLHQMVESVDAGPIVARREVVVSRGDTAHTLYQRILAVEVDLLLDLWPQVRGQANWPLIDNDPAEGTLHRSSELISDAVKLLDLDAPTTARAVIDHLRALTTDRWSEAAEFEVGNRRFRARIELREAESEQAG
jgi:methionyl-tRNA formyltransferase